MPVYLVHIMHLVYIYLLQTTGDGKFKLKKKFSWMDWETSNKYLYYHSFNFTPACSAPVCRFKLVWSIKYISITDNYNMNLNLAACTLRLVTFCALYYLQSLKWPGCLYICVVYLLQIIKATQLRKFMTSDYSYTKIFKWISNTMMS